MNDTDPGPTMVVGTEWQELKRLREAADAAMTAIRDTDFSKAHRLLFEARGGNDGGK
jgi:hypothetical protein